MDSILNTVKKLLGIVPEYTIFDPDLVVAINTSLAVLTQLGIGPESGFFITDETATWSDFMGEDPRSNMAKTYVHLKSKSIFDPPTSSAVSEATNRLLGEMEWRLTIESDRRNHNE